MSACCRFEWEANQTAREDSLLPQRVPLQDAEALRAELGDEARQILDGMDPTVDKDIKSMVDGFKVCYDQLCIVVTAPLMCCVGSSNPS
jgi:hypothetical protein